MYCTNTQTTHTLTRTHYTIHCSLEKLGFLGPQLSVFRIKVSSALNNGLDTKRKMKSIGEERVWERGASRMSREGPKEKGKTLTRMIFLKSVKTCILNALWNIPSASAITLSTLVHTKPTVNVASTLCLPAVILFIYVLFFGKPKTQNKH